MNGSEQIEYDESWVEKCEKFCMDLMNINGRY